MVERCQHAGLALEARQPVRVADDALGQQLERDLTVELEVARPQHDTHPARAERLDDLVVAETGPARAFSDDTQEEFRRWMQARGMGGGGAPGGGDASGNSDVAGGGGGFRGAGGGLLGMMQTFSQNMERLVIEQGDPEVTITYAAGNANMVFTDGRVVERVDEDGGKTKVKTRWKKDKMIVDIDFPTRPNPAGGMITPSLTMTYSVDKSGRLLLASSVSLGAAVPPFSVERVYDREPPAG